MTKPLFVNTAEMTSFLENHLVYVKREDREELH